MTAVVGGVCDRCGELFLIRKFPHSCLCSSCFLAQLTPAQRGALLAQTSVTGERVA